MSNTPLATPRLNVAFSTHPGWGKDYADALTFFSPLFDGRAIYPQGNSNYSLVGLTPATAKKVGVKGDVARIPGVNADLDRCGAMVGTPRVSCYAALDKKLTTKIVPWVPYLWAVDAQRHEQERRAVGLRPVRRDHRVRARRREGVAAATSVRARTGGSARRRRPSRPRGRRP